MDDNELDLQFPGWRDRGYLPHCDNRRRQFITYRLDDALPRAVTDQLREISETAPELRANYSRVLDAGYGSCVLERPECARVVLENWQYHDGSLYELRDYVVMPNHAHVDILPLAALDRILHAWRSYTSTRINGLTGGAGRLWQRGYYDRYHRDEAHSFNVQCYIYLNPVRAGLVDHPFDWEFSSVHRHDSRMMAEIDAWFRRWSTRFHSSV